MSKRLFSKKYLLAALKKAGLPHSYKALLKYERMGVIPQPETAVGRGSMSKYRLYSQEEIDNIVQIMKDYKKA